MQTFLPFEDFKASAESLDYQRLGKQRVECFQIVTALVEHRGWIHHPATKMWTDNLGSLFEYAYAVCDEWVGRGFSDGVATKLMDIQTSCENLSSDPPWWLGSQTFHMTHQSNLIRKKPEHYRSLFPHAEEDYEYLWPGASEGVWHISKPGLARIKNAELRDPRLLLP